METVGESQTAVCGTTGKTFDVGVVEVVARHADCTRFRCPSCGKVHDDRQLWGGRPGQRQGYTMLSQRPVITGWGEVLS